MGGANRGVQSAGQGALPGTRSIHASIRPCSPQLRLDTQARGRKLLPGQVGPLVEREAQGGGPGGDRVGRCHLASVVGKDGATPVGLTSGGVRLAILGGEECKGGCRVLLQVMEERECERLLASTCRQGAGGRSAVTPSQSPRQRPPPSQTALPGDPVDICGCAGRCGPQKAEL